MLLGISYWMVGLFGVAIWCGIVIAIFAAENFDG